MCQLKLKLLCLETESFFFFFFFRVGKTCWLSKVVRSWNVIHDISFERGESVKKGEKFDFDEYVPYRSLPTNGYTVFCDRERDNDIKKPWTIQFWDTGDRQRDWLLWGMDFIFYLLYSFSNVL